MFRLLALAKYDERYVIPTAHAEQAHALEELATECAVSEYGGGQEIFGEGSGGAPTPVAVENFRVLQETQSADTLEALPPDNPLRGRVNLLNWDGRGMPDGIFPGSGREGRPMRWRRHRDAQPGIREQALADTWQVVSLLLDYPDDVLVSRVPMLREVVAELPEAQRDAAGRDARHPRARVTSAGSRRSTSTPSTSPASARLHLTYFTHGDTRRRGVALVEFKQAYRKAGVEFDTDAELPDHLCVVLEFGAVQDWADRVAPAHPAPRRHRGAQGRSRTARLTVAAGPPGAAHDPAPARR